MNIAVIFAGGTGQRMNDKSKPKQFLELYGKPILVYTLERFQYHIEVDGIILVCISEWIEYAKTLIEKYQLDKVMAVVEGGKTGQESIYNGLKKAMEIYPEDSIVLIHDGVRPLIEKNVISRAIDCVKKNGSAITVSPAIETIITIEQLQVNQIIDRKVCQLARAPQCFVLKNIFSMHVRAIEEGISDFIDSVAMMQHYGFSIHTIEGNVDNIKITTPMDFHIFRALVDAKNEK